MAETIERSPDMGQQRAKLSIKVEVSAFLVPWRVQVSRVKIRTTSAEFAFCTWAGLEAPHQLARTPLKWSTAIAICHCSRLGTYAEYLSSECRIIES